MLGRDLHVARAGRLFVVLVALAYGTAVVRVTTGAPVGTTYGATSDVAGAADLAAGLGLLVAGAFAIRTRVRRQFGTLALLAGVAWFAPDWEASVSATPLTHTLGMVAGTVSFAFLFHLILAFPAGLQERSRQMIRGMYAITAAVSLGTALLRDPFLDPECWRNCTDNVFLIHGDAARAHLLDWLAQISTLAAGAVLALVSAARLVAAPPAARRVLAPVVGPGVLVGASAVAYAALLLIGPAEDPNDQVSAGIFLARATAATALALGLGWSVVQARRRQSAVLRLAVELGAAPQPGSLRTALAEALADPDVTIAYPLAAGGRYVDGQGRPVDPPVAGAGRARTPIVAGGHEVAVVVHDATSLEPAELQRQIGSAARIAVENERLAAEALSQLRELRESQARIIATADAERRRLERDLHDGCQQRLLALTYRLRLARVAAKSAGRRDLDLQLGAALDEALDGLVTLRELAHGIFPAVLTESGLSAALWTLAGAAPLPVEIEAIDETRYAAAVETAAYLTVADAIDDAANRGASHAVVRVSPAGNLLNVEIRDDAPYPSGGSPSVSDRVGALGGYVRSGPSLIRAEIPCG